MMNLPTIMRTTQESLKTVPQSYREGAFGLGAGKWRVIRTLVLPNCMEDAAAHGEFALDLLRIGDHCTNIAEWLEFSVTGIHKDCQ